MNHTLRLKLWEEKRDFAAVAGVGKLHIYHRINYVKLCDAIYIEKLMEYLEQQIVRVFSVLMTLDNDYMSSPYEAGQILCDLKDLKAIMPYANLMQSYPLNLLRQCRRIIKARYGWHLALNNKFTDAEFPFPWSKRNSHSDTELIIFDKKSRRQGI